jgi:hypothetical protein
MLEAIGAGSQKRIGGDWGEKWRNSPELQEVKETVRQLNEEALANNHEVSYICQSSHAGRERGGEYAGDPVKGSATPAMCFRSEGHEICAHTKPLAAHEGRSC